MRFIHRTLCAALAIAGSLAVCASAARAQSDYVVVLALNVNANFNTINIHVPLDPLSDVNHDSYATVRYWKTSDGPSLADAGHPLVLDVPRNQFNGKLFWLAEGTSYTVEVTVDDHDGVRGDYIWTSTITTRTTPVPSASLPKVYCSPTGNDVSGNGTSTAPYLTIQKAHDMLPSTGGEIIATGGTYKQSAILSKSAPAASMYVLTGAGLANSTWVDGSADLLSGWTAYKVNNVQVDNIWMRDYTLPAAVSQLNVVIQGTTQRLHRRTSLAEMSVQTPAGVTGPWPIGRFYYAPPAQAGQQGKLYVRLYNAAQPGTTTGSGNAIRVSEKGAGLVVSGARWYIRNLNVRNFNAQAVLLGTLPSGYATDAVVENCRMSQYGGGGVVVNAGTTGCLIQNSDCFDPKIDGWVYSAGKARAEETARGIYWIGSRVVVRNCKVYGTFDGIQTSGNACDAIASQDSDVHNNTIGPVCDDGLELEATAGINVGAWNNLVTGANHGFSGAPVYAGPMYVMYNDIVNCDQAGIKNGDGVGCNPAPSCLGCVGSVGWVGFYHNTITSTATFMAAHDTGGLWGNQHYLNNILVGVHGNYGNQGPFVANFGNEGDFNTTTFNNDLVYFHNNITGQPIWRAGFIPNTQTNFTYLTVGPSGDLCVGGAYGPARLWECSGVYGQPVFADSANRDYSLVSGSPGINIGALISGINTPSHTTAPRYSGTAPDAGAHEFTGPGQQARAVPADAEPGLVIGRPGPNPTRAGVAFAVELPRSLRTEARVYDVAGRVVRTVSDRNLAAGKHTLRWDGSDDSGARVTPGLYFMRVRIGGHTSESRVIMIK